MLQGKIHLPEACSRAEVYPVAILYHAPIHRQNESLHKAQFSANTNGPGQLKVHNPAIMSEPLGCNSWPVLEIELDLFLKRIKGDCRKAASEEAAIGPSQFKLMVLLCAVDKSIFS